MFTYVDSPWERGQRSSQTTIQRYFQTKCTGDSIYYCNSKGKWISLYKAIIDLW